MLRDQGERDLFIHIHYTIFSELADHLLFFLRQVTQGIRGIDISDVEA